MKNNPIYRFLAAALHLTAAYYLYKIDLWDMAENVAGFFDKFAYDFATLGPIAGMVLFLLICFKGRWWRLTALTTIGLVHMYYSFQSPETAESFGYMVAAYASFSICVITIRGIYFAASLENMPKWMRGQTLRSGLVDLFDGILEEKRGSKGGEGEKSGLIRAMQFRDAKLGNMGAVDGAKYLRDTSALDAAAYGTGTNTSRAASYLSAKLGNMSNEQGMDYLRDK